MFSKEALTAKPPPSRPPLIHVPDFQITKFNGDLRATLRVVHQITNHLDSEGLLWILNIDKNPEPVAPAYLVTIKGQNKLTCENAHSRFLENLSVGHLWPLLNTNRMSTPSIFKTSTLATKTP